MKLYKNGVELPNIGLNANFIDDTFLVEGTISSGIVITIDDNRRDLIALKTSLNEFDDLVTEPTDYDFNKNDIISVDSAENEWLWI